MNELPFAQARRQLFRSSRFFGVDAGHVRILHESITYGSIGLDDGNYFRGVKVLRTRVSFKRFNFAILFEEIFLPAYCFRT